MSTQKTPYKPHRPVPYSDTLRAQIDELEHYLSGSSGPHPHGTLEQMREDIEKCREELELIERMGQRA